MGYIVHHAIIVSASYDVRHEEGLSEFDGMHYAELAHLKAKELCTTCPVTEIVDSPMNGTRSFMVATDGSKEGWGHSDDGDEDRDRFIEWLESIAYEDGSSPVSWVEVQYNDDDLDTKVLRNSDAICETVQDRLYPGSKS